MPIFRFDPRAVLAVLALSLTATAAIAADSAPVELLDLQNGDRACYAVVRAGKSEQSLEAAFELCPGGSQDASRWIGKMVTYAKKPGRVQAMSCAGDPSCKKTDAVDLIVRLSPVGNR